MGFQNNPLIHDNDNKEGMIKRYVHQPLVVDHYGIHASIQENGKVKITGQGTPVAGSNDFTYDEVTIPASLIFKLATLLKATRTIKYVPMAEAGRYPTTEEQN